MVAVDLGSEVMCRGVKASKGVQEVSMHVSCPVSHREASSSCTCRCRGEALAGLVGFGRQLFAAFALYCQLIVAACLQMQACGSPPKDIVDELAPGLEMGADGLPKMPGDAASACCIQ